MSTREKIVRADMLARELGSLREQIAREQRACSHAWEPTRYDPEKGSRAEFDHFEGHGSDPEPVYNHYPIDIPRWSRVCSKCGKVEYTKEQRPTKTEPHFG